MLTRRGVLLAKVETSYGVDAVPTPSANALMVTNLEVKPDQELIARDILRDTLSPVELVPGLAWYDVSFQLELKGSGTRGSLPSWGWEGAVMQACGMIETVTGATSIVWSPTSGLRQAMGTMTIAGVSVADEQFIVGAQTFTFKAARGGVGEVTIGASADAACTNIAFAINTDLATVEAVADLAADKVYVQATTAGTAGNALPFSETATNLTMNGSGYLGGTVSGKDDFKSASLYVYKDQLFHKMLGWRGNAVISGQRGQRQFIKVDGKALYAGPTDFGPGATTLSTVLPPVLLSAGCVIGSYSPVFSKYEINLGNTVSKRENANAATGIEEFFISAKAPKGSIDPEAVSEATKTFWADWRAGTAQVFNVGPVGSVSGNIIEINCPKAQIEKMGYGDRDGRLTYDIPLHIAGDAGDDEITITIT